MVPGRRRSQTRLRNKSKDSRSLQKPPASCRRDLFLRSPLLAWPVTVEWRSTVNQQSLQMMWSLVSVNNDHIRAAWRNGDKIGVRHLICLATRHVNLVGHKRYRVIEFANRFNDHAKIIISLNT